MIQDIYQGIVSALMHSDTQTVMSLLQDAKEAFKDPLEGPGLHAEVLYYAIKKANHDAINFLLNLCVPSDISFFNYCGQSPLGLALEEGLNEEVPLLIAKTDTSFALCMAVKLKNSKIVQLLRRHCVFKDRLLHSLGLK